MITAYFQKEMYLKITYCSRKKKRDMPVDSKVGQGLRTECLVLWNGSKVLTPYAKRTDHKDLLAIQ